MIVSVNWRATHAYNTSWDLSDPAQVQSLASTLQIYEDDYEGDDFPGFLVTTLETYADNLYDAPPMVADNFLEFSGDNNWYDADPYDVEIGDIEVSEP